MARRSVMSVNEATVEYGAPESACSGWQLSEIQTRWPSGRRTHMTRPFCERPVRRVCAVGWSAGRMGRPASSRRVKPAPSVPTRSAAGIPRMRCAAGLTDSTSPVEPTTTTPSSSEATTVV